MCRTHISLTAIEHGLPLQTAAKFTHHSTASPQVTFARLPVTAESWSCQITEQTSMFFLPMTFPPWLIATARLFEEVKLPSLSFEMRGQKANGFLVP